MNKKQIENYLRVNPFEQLSDVVFNLLEEEISSLNLKPGEKLNIAEISEEFGVSRTPVRDALIKLGKAGYVEKLPNKKSFYVCELSINDIKEIYFVRSMIECKTAFLCSQRQNCADINKLKELVSEFNEEYINHHNNYIKLAYIDYEFHRNIALSSKNQYLIYFFNFMGMKFKRLQKSNLKFIITNNKEEIIHKIMAEHNAIINSISLNMSELAEKEIINHINGGLNDTLLFLK